MNVGEFLFALIGLLLLAVGTAIGDVYMFRGNVPAVMVGVFLIVVGYQTIHYGVHGNGMVRRLSSHSSEAVTPTSRFNWIQSVVFLLLSVFLVAQGFVIGAQATMKALSIVDMVACGAFIVGGYITGHVGVHGEIL